ncbi:hypothetical protein [Flocculibacter collagenilyticus]|uniref:hypothetical protein n=1 Tax=Flocculibacter collagenilyticus TaxID=2744479 RepID=UPI0018F413F0|nr:hypothetical protein [Flocculibacter collagenilyticus]
MKTFTKTALLSTSLLFLPNAFAGLFSGDIDGRYIPKAGYAKTLEVGRMQLGEAPKQQGKYQLVFERENWSSLSNSDQQRIRRFLIMYGTLSGEMDLSTYTLDHILVASDRNGAFYTEDDFLTPTEGDPVCASGTPLKGVEQINFVSGTGSYAHLISGTVYVDGVVNNCYGQEDFGQNNFQMIAEQGELVFDTTN